MQNKLGIRLKELRKMHNYNQDYVAGFLSIARQTYSHYESGTRTPKPDILYKLAGLYHIPVEDLMHLCIEIDRNTYFDAPEPSESSIRLKDMLEYFDRMENRKKYQNNNILEKELLYFFEKLSEHDKKEIIEFTKIKARNSDPNS